MGTGELKFVLYVLFLINVTTGARIIIIFFFTRYQRLFRLGWRDGDVRISIHNIIAYTSQYVYLYLKIIVSLLLGTYIVTYVLFPGGKKTSVL